MPSSRPRALLTALAALTPALAGCVAAKTDSVRNVVDMVRQGQYAEARDRARELAAERPDDPELQRLARDIYEERLEAGTRVPALLWRDFSLR